MTEAPGRATVLVAAAVAATALSAAHSSALAQPSEGASSETERVVVEGRSAIQGDVPTARDRAVEAALRRAVERVSGLYLAARTETRRSQVVEDRILSRARGYVADYEILDAFREDSLSVVRVAARVRSGTLVKDMRALGILLAQKDFPRVAVVLDAASREADRAAPQDARSTASDALEALFTEHRISAVPADRAEILVRGSLDLAEQEAADRYGLKSVEATLSLRAEEAGSGRLLASATGQAAEAASTRPAAVRKAAASAAEQVGNDLLDGLIRRWVRETSEGRAVSLEVAGVRSYEQLLSFEEQLRREAPRTDDVVERDFRAAQDRAVLEWRGGLEPTDLAEFIQRHPFQGFAAVVTGTSEGSVTVELRPRTPDAGRVRPSERRDTEGGR